MSILTVQQMLDAAGFNPGPLDGVWGLKTRAALAEALELAKRRHGPPDSPVDPVLLAAIMQDEGKRLKAYKDTVGVWTIGYGHTGPEVKPGLVWTEGQAKSALIKDIAEHVAELHEKLPWVTNLDPVRRRVLENMAFNLGVGNALTGKGLLGFRNTLEHVRLGRYEQAAAGMLASKWARQVKGRAVRLAQEMRTGQS